MSTGTPTSHVLRHANGTAVTAQEAYDAFMNTRVLIVHGGNAFEIISIVWYDNNSAQANPTNVGYVKLIIFAGDNSGAAIIATIEVGDKSLDPA